MKALQTFLEKLEREEIYYTISKGVRDEAPIMVIVRVPEEVWEVEFLQDGTVEVEVLKSDGTVYDKNALDEMLEKHRL